ncbi:uncharacterized protein NECHADRAFT_78769 [Fusarium vanettenii 77-13-4]|uniref:Uncharacterized protein n=1 Tax=Fusarium vanettenii (strain ATCC MYA-4622 / CBS 123669 / FGSC 9596 / NRRL 45880 / 77-13-4) TaxID=660122 RepID=C7YPI8_FUSV7|nr:uncharacterized protein NECHADRAFT_78769 [Fusarium vanettenii 77-13-4]EEU45853.1 predicted protein [Fusarium vanettenii 77-13-4]
MSSYGHTKSASSSSSASAPTPSRRRDKKSQQAWTHTHQLPTAEQRSLNGRKKDRNLISWTRPRMSDKLLQVLVYECNRAKIRLPWDQVAHRLNPGSSGSSIIQWLGRNRNDLIAEGHIVPPPLSPRADRTVRGVMRADLDGDDTSTTREVLFTEPLYHPEYSLDGAPEIKDPFTSQMEAAIGAPEAHTFSDAHLPVTPTPVSRRRRRRHHTPQPSVEESVAASSPSSLPSLPGSEVSCPSPLPASAESNEFESPGLYLPELTDDYLSDLPADYGNESPSAYLDEPEADSSVNNAATFSDGATPEYQVVFTSPITASNAHFMIEPVSPDSDSDTEDFDGYPFVELDERGLEKSSVSEEEKTEPVPVAAAASVPVAAPVVAPIPFADNAVQNFAGPGSVAAFAAPAFGSEVPFDAEAIAASLPPPPPFDVNDITDWSWFPAAAQAAAEEINQTDLLAGLDFPQDILGSGTGVAGFTAGDQGYGFDLTYQFPVAGSVADDVFFGAGGQGQPAFSQNLKRMRGEGEGEESPSKRGCPGWFIPQ